jgi:DNA invertase Pin-like site-specific DNA recombinase
LVSFLKGGQPQGEYVEVESGKKDQRPQLLAAMAAARTVGGVLLIAKLDRRSRNASFIFTLRDSDVDFVCCDMPDANTLTVGLFAVLTQHERETISKRAKKARGARLGTPANLTAAAREQSLLMWRAHLQQHPGLRQTAAFIASRRAQGVSFRQLAEESNDLGFTAPRGGISSKSKSSVCTKEFR